MKTYDEVKQEAETMQRLKRFSALLSELKSATGKIGTSDSAYVKGYWDAINYASRMLIVAFPELQESEATNA